MPNGLCRVSLLGTEQRGAMALAERAKIWFDAHPGDHSFSDGEIKPGELIAIKWAFDRELNNTISVLVMRIPHDAALVGDLDNIPQARTK